MKTQPAPSLQQRWPAAPRAPLPHPAAWPSARGSAAARAPPPPPGAWGARARRRGAAHACGCIAGLCFAADAAPDGSTSLHGAPTHLPSLLHPPPLHPPTHRSYDSLIDPSLPPEEVRRLRRQLSNRESARRSRRRRETELSSLEVQLEQMRSGAFVFVFVLCWCCRVDGEPSSAKSGLPGLRLTPSAPAPPRPARPEQSARACNRS